MLKKEKKHLLTKKIKIILTMKIKFEQENSNLIFSRLYGLTLDKIYPPNKPLTTFIQSHTQIEFRELLFSLKVNSLAKVLSLIEFDEY